MIALVLAVPLLACGPRDVVEEQVALQQTVADGELPSYATRQQDPQTKKKAGSAKKAAVEKKASGKAGPKKASAARAEKGDDE